MPFDLISDGYSQGQVADTVVYKKDDFASLSNQISELKNNKNLRHLTIRVKENTGWAVFSKDFDVEEKFFFSFQNTLKKIPPVIGDLKDLESLDIVYLGLEELPDEIIQLENLKHINLSFNNIEIEREVNKILSLPRLETIRAYSCKISSEMLAEIKKRRPDVKVLYTRQQLYDDFNTKK